MNTKIQILAAHKNPQEISGHNPDAAESELHVYLREGKIKLSQLDQENTVPSALYHLPPLSAPHRTWSSDRCSVRGRISVTVCEISHFTLYLLFY